MMRFSFLVSVVRGKEQLRLSVQMLSTVVNKEQKDKPSSVSFIQSYGTVVFLCLVMAPTISRKHTALEYNERNFFGLAAAAGPSFEPTKDLAFIAPGCQVVPVLQLFVQVPPNGPLYNLSKNAIIKPKITETSFSKVQFYVQWDQQSFTRVWKISDPTVNFCSWKANFYVSLIYHKTTLIFIVIEVITFMKCKYRLESGI